MMAYLVLESNMEGGNMRCQIPGCKNKGIKASTKEGIFCGVHLEHVMVYTCGKHSKVEIEEALERVGEDEASILQQVNPFTGIDEAKIFNKTA
jgi:hypothetical protein